MKNQFTAKDAIRLYKEKCEAGINEEFELIIEEIKKSSLIPELSCKYEKEINKLNVVKLAKLGFNVIQEKVDKKYFNTISWHE